MSAADGLAEIKRLYFGATKATIGRDVERAIDLLKAMPDEDARARAAVYMDGLAQMRSEWGVRGGGPPAPAQPGPAAARPPRPRR